MTNSFLASGLFGHLFHDPEIASAFSAERFTGQMITFEAAWTQAMLCAGRITDEDARAAIEAMEHFTPDIARLGEGSNRDGLPLPTLAAELKALAPKGSVHTGATSQDVIDTAMVLTLLSVTQILSHRLSDLCDKLDALQTKFETATLMGRTRMQAALPITGHQRIESWRTPLQAHLDAVSALVAGLSFIQAGGAVGDRPYPDVAAEAARILGLKLGPVWHTDRTPFIEFGHWCAKLCGSLGKIGQDVALMAQQGVEAVEISGGGGSSAMPHKSNPINAETIVTLARYAAHMQGFLLGAMVHEQERSGVAWAQEWIALPTLAETTGAALARTEDLFGQITRIGTVTA